MSGSVKDIHQYIFLDNCENSCFSFDPKGVCNLKKAILKTKISRFKAADRLKFYDTVTNWIFTLLSLMLLTLTLYNFIYTGAFDERLFDFVQAELSLSLLVFSLMISNYNYAVRSIGFHTVGMEMSHLAKKMDFINIENTTSKCIEKFKQIYNEYNNTLRRNENHQNVDYNEYMTRNYPTQDDFGTCCNDSDISSTNKKLKYKFRKYVLGLLPQWTILVISLLLSGYMIVDTMANNGYYFDFENFVYTLALTIIFGFFVWLILKVID